MRLDETYYQDLCRIRWFEETVMANFSKGVFGGTTHTALGQEANAVGVLSNLQPGDVVFSNHRCHGHYLAYGGDPRALFAEMMGKPAGVCGGRGGSQHLQWRDFYSNGVQGGILPLAAGMALAEVRLDSGAVAVCFLGDGTLGEGLVYETLNMAALWGAPVLFVVEDNRIAQTTPVETAMSGDMAARFTTFGVRTVEMDSSDVVEIAETSREQIIAVRSTQSPQALILHTCRFGPHSKSDDTRPEDVVAAMWETRDPLVIHGERLPEGVRKEVEIQVEAEIEACYQQALADPAPGFGEEMRIATYKSVPVLNGDADNQAVTGPKPTPASDGPLKKGAAQDTVLGALNRALHTEMSRDDRVLVLGEDILDPYGGAFMVTQGLFNAFPDRVIASPISEAGLVGVGAGMAMRGLRPVVEIMFGDFLTLAADQLVNHAAKFRWMYNNQVRVPLVVRAPMGGRRGYGPTHSQTLEKHFLGVPGLLVLAPTALGDPGGLLTAAIQAEDPVLFIENKLLYTIHIQNQGSLEEFNLEKVHSSGTGPCYRLQIKGAPAPDLTLVTYGYMAELSRQAALKLAYEDEIFVEILVLTQLSPYRLDPVVSSVEKTGRVLAVEEGSLTLGWGAEVITQVSERLGSGLVAAGRVAARDLPVPASPILELQVLPAVSDILSKARALVAGTG